MFFALRWRLIRRLRRILAYLLALLAGWLFGFCQPLPLSIRIACLRCFLWLVLEPLTGGELLDGYDNGFGDTDSEMDYDDLVADA